MRFNVTLDCADPEELAKFWMDAFGFTLMGFIEPFAMLRPADGKGPRLILQRVPEPKVAKNRMHLDFQVDEADHAAELERIKGLGARQLTDEPRGKELGMHWIVMADPEGNEFCFGCRPGASS